MPVMGQEEAPEARAHGHRPPGPRNILHPGQAGTCLRRQIQKTAPKLSDDSFFETFTNLTINKTDILLLKLNI